MMKFFFKISAFILLFVSFSSAQTQIQKIADISLAPVSTFKNFCSRCHGDEGSAYGKTFGKLKDDSLRTITEDMMFGPGGLNPSKIEVNVMADYNKSLYDKKPFGTVLNLKSFVDGKEKTLKIESSPGTELTLDNESIKIEKKNDLWELNFDPSKIKQFKISFIRNGFTSFLKYPDEICTE